MVKNDLRTRDLRVGDLLLYRDGKSWLARLIRWGTDSDYSHALLYLGHGLCIESDFSLRKYFLEEDYRSGVRLVPLRVVRERGGSHDVFRSLQKLKNIRKVAKIYVLRGFKYDFLGLLWQAVVAAKIKFFARQTHLIAHEKNKYYCSELCREIHEKCGAFVFDGLLPAETTPATESVRPDLKFIGNLVSTKCEKI